MYFATNSARVLAVPINAEIETDYIIGIGINSRRSHFVVLTSSEISVWKVRPPVLLASLRRTQISLDEHGLNLAASWSPDGSKIVVQTTTSHIILLNLYQTPDFQPFSKFRSLMIRGHTFLPGPGEGITIDGLYLQLHGVINTDGDLIWLSPRASFLLFSTRNPAAVQRMPWPQDEGTVDQNWLGHETWSLESQNFPWIDSTEDTTLYRIHFIKSNAPEGWVSSDGKAYLTQNIQQSSLSGPKEEESSDESPTRGGTEDTWTGVCIYSPTKTEKPEPYSSRAVEIALNPRFSIAAVGTESGDIVYLSFPAGIEAQVPPKWIEIPEISLRKACGRVNTFEWTSDGYALAVGWEYGWAVISVGGRFLSWAIAENYSHPQLKDYFMRGVSHLFWGPGNFDLFLLSNSDEPNQRQVFILPFAKSSFTAQQTPENTRYAFLMMEDRVLVYRGADQPDMSVINPESDVWQHIKTPIDYISNNWPLRYSTISNDGRLIAVAGRRGLIHYSMSSGRWKQFEDPSHEQAFFVRGGLIWFHHVLIAAVEMANKTYQVHLYSRDHELSPKTILFTEALVSPIVTLSLVDNSLLVYTASNELYHYLVIPTSDSVVLHSCGSISFEGVVAAPNLVRGMSWMIPLSQKNFGDAADDMTCATITLLIGGQLVLLTPRKNSTRDVKYDLKILADRIEFCWIHLRGVGALENSLWGFDGEAVRVWLDALTIGTTSTQPEAPNVIVENVRLPLEFYPLSVLMDKGIIIGAEQEIVSRASLPVAVFRLSTLSQLFIHHVLLYHLQKKQVQEAVQFAANYQALVFFSHSLEVLLHTVLEDEDETEESQSVLPEVVEFLDHFDVSMEVVVSCARKTEMTRWDRLFKVVGDPKALFEASMRDTRLPTAASYLLVLHNIQQLEETIEDAVKLLSKAIEKKSWDIAKDLMRFLRSIDEDGAVLKDVLRRAGFPEIDN
ncbi:hypothetical protein FRC14_004091 [Serendipita sp. 396]|nr:hypothetical protein FRC14_004091 [Serendipita sp. 396]